MTKSVHHLELNRGGVVIHKKKVVEIRRILLEIAAAISIMDV